ncbi:MAG: dihydrofolate reductase family protein [bacterium]|nr:dihydrofolate reductase family protein [bacterium]
MNVFLIAAISTDGFIAPSNGALLPSTAWTSGADKKFFTERTKQAGVIIMGSRTFETIGRPLPGRHTIVYSNDKTYEGVETTNKDPHLLLKDLEKRGYTEVAICGGASVYTMFLEAGLINTFYLTVEPVLFGQGVSLFSKAVSVNLSLQTITKLDNQSILIEYGIRH